MTDWVVVYGPLVVVAILHFVILIVYAAASGIQRKEDGNVR